MDETFEPSEFKLPSDSDSDEDISDLDVLPTDEVERTSLQTLEKFQPELSTSPDSAEEEFSPPDRPSRWSRAKYHTTQLGSIVKFPIALLILALGYIKMGSMAVFRIVFGSESRSSDESMEGGGMSDFIKKQVQNISRKLSRDPVELAKAEKKVAEAINNKPEKFTRKLMNAMGFGDVPLKKYHVTYVKLWVKWCWSKNREKQYKCNVLNDRIKNAKSAEKVEEIVNKFLEIRMRPEFGLGKELKQSKKKKLRRMKETEEERIIHPYNELGGAMNFSKKTISSRGMYNHGIHGRNTDLYWFNKYRKMKKLYKQLKRRQ